MTAFLEWCDEGANVFLVLVPLLVLLQWLSLRIALNYEHKRLDRIFNRYRSHCCLRRD